MKNLYKKQFGEDEILALPLLFFYGIKKEGDGKAPWSSDRFKYR